MGQVLSRQVSKFKRRIDDWELDEKIKKLTPSKCQISQEFCSKACHSIGRISGVCNEDFTDCDCSDEYVSAKQYGLCAVDSICKYDCQRRKYIRDEICYFLDKICTYFLHNLSFLKVDMQEENV